MLTKNADADKYGYSGIVFDAHLQISSLIGEWRENVIFVVDNSLSRHTDNRKKDFQVLGEGSVDGLDDTTQMAEAKYSIIASALYLIISDANGYNEESNGSKYLTLLPTD